MNYNKVIKDLKERNNKLESQRRQFELNLYHEQHLVEEKDKEIERLNNIIQSINSVCSSMQFSAPENMYIHVERMIEILDYWKKEKKND